MLYPLPGPLPLPERTVRSPDWALVSWLRQGPGVHPRRCPQVHLLHRPPLHLQRCPSRAPRTTSCSLSPAHATSGSGRGGAITPRAHPEGPFALSKANTISCLPPLPAWDSSILLPLLAGPLIKMHPWPYGPSWCFQKGVVGRNAECGHSLTRVPWGPGLSGVFYTRASGRTYFSLVSP